MRYNNFMIFLSRSAFLFSLFVFSIFILTGQAVAQSSQYVYRDMSLEVLSKLYWALDAVSLENDTHVDNYLLINECDIYQEFRNNEFEWQNIRAATRQSLRQKKDDFARRVEVVQPLFLKDYDIENQTFAIRDEYIPQHARRYEVLTDAYRNVICNHEGDIEGYPKGLIVELTRPFKFENVPVEPKVAEEYIEMKLAAFNELFDHLQTRQRFLESRDAYMVMKMRIFEFKETIRTQAGYNLNVVFAVLEGLEVYGDPDKRMLLYRKEFDFYKPASDFEQRLKAQYEAMMQRKGETDTPLHQQDGVGLLHRAKELTAGQGASSE